MKDSLFFSILMAGFLPLMLAGKRILWRKFAKYAQKTSVTWDDLLLERLHAPTDLVVAIAAVTIAGHLAPEVLNSLPAVIYAIKILLIGSLFWITDRLVGIFFSTGVLSIAVTGSTRVLLVTILRVINLLIGLLIILDTVGISITPILASLGVGSLAVALALQDTLSNFFSGIYLLVDKPIAIGDNVRIDGGIEGKVVQIGWRCTHILLPSNNTVVIPNSKIASAHLTNFNLPTQEILIPVKVGVAYGSDLDRVERITVEVASEVMGKLYSGAESSPVVRFNELADSSINFNVFLQGREFDDQALLRHEFIKSLHQRFKSEGIEIPFPQTVVHMKPN